jgi:hypothetical protein
MAKLRAAIADRADNRVHCLVGTMQPTLQSIRFAADGTPSFAEAVADSETRRREDHRGDGTVFRYAALPEGVEPSFIPQSHGSLQKTNEGIEFAVAVATNRPLGAFQAGSPIGIRVTDVAVAGIPFGVEVVEGDVATICTVHDAESNRLVTVAQLVRVGEHREASLLLGAAGLYRISVAAGGFSPVERLVLVVEPD